MRGSRQRSQTGLVLAGAVIVLAGFGIALVEMYRWPKWSIWAVIGAAVLVVAIIRVVSTRRS
jgi:hypothetical protein